MIASRQRAWILAAIGLALALGAHGQEATDFKPRDSEAPVDLSDIVIHDSVDLGLQQVYATVTGSGGERVLGLEPGVFELKDQGSKQEIVTLGAGNVPFTAVVLVDASLSMEGPAFAAAWEGLRSFVQGMRPLDEARIVLFSHQVLWSSPFAQDPDALEFEPARRERLGGTAVLDHLYMGLRLLEPRHGRPVILLLSDGVDVHSVLNDAQVRNAFRRSPAALYWLRLGDVSEDPEPLGGAPLERDKWGNILDSTRQWLTSFRPPELTSDYLLALEKVVRESGGRTLPVASRDRIGPALAEVLQELREQYALGYYPPAAKDESWRKLSLKVHGSSLRVRTRAGYFP